MKNTGTYNRPFYSDYPNLSIYKAARYMCVDCACNQPSIIRDCPDFNCPLWRFRHGVNPRSAEARGLDVRGLRGGASPRERGQSQAPLGFNAQD